jgi:hypothetical protein
MWVLKHRETVQWYWYDLCWLYRGASDGCGEIEEETTHNEAASKPLLVSFTST